LALVLAALALFSAAVSSAVMAEADLGAG